MLRPNTLKINKAVSLRDRNFLSKFDFHSAFYNRNSADGACRPPHFSSQNIVSCRANPARLLAGPPASVLLHVVAPEKMIGWARAPREAEKRFLLSRLRDLPCPAGRGVLAIGRHLIGEPVPEPVRTVLFQIRLPRILAAMLVGATLAAAGAAYQSLFRNPPVSPDILGVSTGAWVMVPTFSHLAMRRRMRLSAIRFSRKHSVQSWLMTHCQHTRFAGVNPTSPQIQRSRCCRARRSCLRPVSTTTTSPAGW
jgi:hypothetical protein